MTPLELQNLTSLFATAAVCNHKGFPVWFRFSGHVGEIHISCMEGGYEPGKDHVLDEKFYLWKPDAQRNINVLRQAIKDSCAWNDVLANSIYREGRA